MRNPRFTIQNLMVAIAGIAVLIWIWQIGNAILVGVFGMLIPTGLGYLAWRLARDRPGVAAWTVGIVSVPASLIAARLCIEPLPLAGIVVVWMVALAVSPILAGGVYAWGEADHPRGWTVRRGVIHALILILAILPLSLALTVWPLHLAFRLARPEMVRLADQVAAGVKLTSPREVGAYTVVEIRVDPDHPGDFAILLDNDPAGETGFVHTRYREGYSTYDNLGIVPSDYAIYLGGDWYYMIED